MQTSGYAELISQLESRGWALRLPLPSSRAIEGEAQDSKKGFRGFIQRFFAGGLLTKSSDEWLD